MLLDLILFALAITGPILYVEATVCNVVTISITVFGQSIFMFVRVIHIVAMFGYILFILPCYCFNDSCCIKKCLISKKGVSKNVIAQL